MSIGGWGWPGEVGGGSAGRSTAGDSGAEVGSGEAGRLGEGSSDALKVRGLEKVEAAREAKQTSERLQEQVAEQQEQALKRVVWYCIPSRMGWNVRS